MYTVSFSKAAVRDFKKIMKSNPRGFKKLENIIEELKEHPRIGIGNPEELKHKDGEIWSRRLNKKDRIIYEIFEEEISITVIQALGHYDNR